MNLSKELGATFRQVTEESSVWEYGKHAWPTTPMERKMYDLLVRLTSKPAA